VRVSRRVGLRLVRQIVHREPRDAFEVAQIAGHQRELILQRGGCDQRVGNGQLRRSTNSARRLRYVALNRKLDQSLEHLPNARLVRVATGKELAASHDRDPPGVVDQVEASVSAQMIDQDVSIQQDCGHALTLRSITLDAVPVQVEAIPLLAWRNIKIGYRSERFVEHTLRFGTRPLSGIAAV
jgi:hypothetical protein